MNVSSVPHCVGCPDVIAPHLYPHSAPGVYQALHLQCHPYNNLLPTASQIGNALQAEAGSYLPLSLQSLAQSECSVKLLKGQMAPKKEKLGDAFGLPLL